MKRWRLEIFARERGAIGICSTYSIVVEADNQSTALLRAYETHEHISLKSITEILKPITESK